MKKQTTQTQRILMHPPVQESEQSTDFFAEFDVGCSVFILGIDINAVAVKSIWYTGSF